MCLGDVAADRQAQAAATAGAIARGLGAVEAFEQPLALVRIHPRRAVFDHQFQHRATAYAAHLHRAAGVGVAQRVFQQVAQQLLQTALIAVHLQRAGIDLRLHLQLRGGKARAQAVQHGCQDDRQIDGSAPIRQRTDVGQRHVVQVLDQLAQLADLLVQRPQRVGCHRPDAVLQRFQFGAQYRQRCAQLVRDVGHEVAPRAFVVLQRLRQQVEVARQLAQFVARRGVDAGGVVARSEQVCGVGQAAQAPQQGPRQQPAEHRGDQQAGAADRPPRALLRGVKARVRRRKRLLERQHRHPADGAAANHHRAQDVVAADIRIADHRRVVLVEQCEAKHRTGLVGNRRRLAWRAGATFRAHQHEPGIGVVAHELPVAVPRVFGPDPRQGLLHALHALFVEVVQELAFDEGLHGDAVDQQHRHARGEDGEKQLGGDTQFHRRGDAKRGNRSCCVLAGSRQWKSSAFMPPPAISKFAAHSRRSVATFG